MDYQSAAGPQTCSFVSQRSPGTGLLESKLEMELHQIEIITMYTSLTGLEVAW